MNVKWEQRKLGDVVNFFSGLTYHPSDVKNKGYFVIRSSNIQNNQIVSADDIFVNKDIINVPNVKQGDIIVVVRNGSRKLIGKHAQVLTDMPNTVIGAFMTGVRSKSNFYINALLDSDQFQKEIYKNLGATINQITIGEFRKMRFIITSGNEAQTIGEFFKKIDTLITLQQRKLEQLKQLKKAMLQQLFVSKNSKQPVLRFKNFDSDWRQYSLKDISAKTYSGLSGKSKDDFGHGKARYITYLNVHNNEVAVSDGVEQIEVDSKQNKVLKGDLLFTISSEVPSEVALNSVWPFEAGKDIYLNSFCFGIRPKSNYINSFFLTYCLRSPQMRKLIYPLAQGISRFNISKQSILALKINIPVLPEQINIYKVLMHIDNLITLRQNKLTQLTTLKKYLLQNLFI
ncbi:restriction endonuclease subunit S [Limosilactobacillus reuteri]|uniref:restriction endonuclease subunit S n=2 Tax=Bacillota TaxID=1239 RepID=UPI001CDB5660|nr:restriction endonuclease subunit S [Limosilactobacillus reuteri]